MELLSQILFYIVAFGLIISALGVIFAPKIVYSLLFAFKTFILVGFVFFMLNAPFNAAAQIAIYGVAVSILFAFSIMMTAQHKEKNLYLSIAPRSFLAVVGIFLTVASVVALASEDLMNEVDFPFVSRHLTAVFDTSLDIAKGIFSNYIFVYELLAVFLLIAVVGVGAIISHKRSEDS